MKITQWLTRAWRQKPPLSEQHGPEAPAGASSSCPEQSSPDHALPDQSMLSMMEQISAMQYDLEARYRHLHTAFQTQQFLSRTPSEVEEQSEAIYKASLDAIIVANDQDEIVEFNPVAEQIFGWERHEVIGRTMTQTIVPHHLREAHLKGMKHFLNTGEGPVLNKRIELPALHRDGHEFPIEISISAAKTRRGHIFVSYIRDITQRLKQQTELKIAAHAFETSQPVCITDRDGQIVRVNPAFCAITGYPADAVTGRHPRTLTTNADDDAFHLDIEQSLQQAGHWGGEITFKHQQGHEIPVHMNISSIKGEQDTIHYFVAHLFDLSERKKNEQILLAAQQSAEHASWAKSRFLAVMSHEIRTPMNGVLGVLGLLRETELNELQSRLVKTARESGELLMSIINDILDFSKMEAGKLSLENHPFDMHELFEQTIDVVYPQAEKKTLTLSSHIGQDVPQFLEGDGDRIRQVLLNLLSNAVKYTDAGSIKVALLCLHQTSAEAMLKIEVADTGIGIASEHLSTLFDEFTMAEANYNRIHEGSGLGLAICKRLIQQMNGEIYVESKVGQGSVFSVIITLKHADEQDCQRLPQATEEYPIESLQEMRVLMAEDNPANQVVLRTMLESSGLSIDIVSNGEEAVESVSKIPYDIVLMDISMPGMDGLEATKRIRQLATPAKDVVIVALTAHALRGDRENFLKAGMNDFISKPFTRQAILDCLSRWHARKTQQENTPPSSTPQHSKTVSPINSFSTHALMHQSIHTFPLVDETTLKQLAMDIPPSAIPELIGLYIEDAKKRVKKIEAAFDESDCATLEFEAHTLSSSAAAHGNSQLFHYCRDIEKMCVKQQHEQVLKCAPLFSQIATNSFIALQKRAALVLRHFLKTATDKR